MPARPLMPIRQAEFERELSNLMNRFGVDQLTETPDFVLARMLVESLECYKAARLATMLHEKKK